MSSRKTSVFISFISVSLFSLLNLAPSFSLLENRMYDVFLRLCPQTRQTSSVVFIDVDDAAIAKVGIFPWPRSVMAEGLLRLKEYNARLAVMDIEYIDKSPTHVDEAYLRSGLAQNYRLRFSNIGTTVTDILNAVSSGRIPRERISSYIDAVMELIGKEQDALLSDVMKITRDDDLFLAQAAALFGRTWGTLNIQDRPLSGEQAQRRSMAQRRFSYPVSYRGGYLQFNNVDVLPPIPLFADAVQGAGFTNITVDPDGVRRRLFLAQEVNGHWYLQLAFAPVMDLWGRPTISLEKRRLVVERPEGKMVIPLDATGAMLLDWPPELYVDSFAHVSFVKLAALEEYQAHIEEYLSALSFANANIFPVITERAPAILRLFETAAEMKGKALEECSDALFAEYLSLRGRGLEQTGAFLAAIAGQQYTDEAARRIIAAAGNNDPALAAAVEEEAGYCQTLLEYIDTELNAFFTVHRELQTALDGKFCVVGRVDTGTTDIGSTPFHGEYVNAGTHAVVLDSVLRGSFIVPLPALWSVLFALFLTPLVIIGTSAFKPGIRSALGILGILLSAGLPLGLFFAKRIFLGPLGPILSVTSAVIVREVIAFINLEKEKQFIRRAFSTYISAGVVEEIIADPSRLNLGGEKRDMTAMFTDIQGFSAISEKLEPVRLVRLINNYLTVMSTIIMNNLGTIDKYEGDAIIAFFGAPVHHPDHASLACRSALAMKRAETELNKNIAAQELSSRPLITRIGINSGEMVVGNMGSENKMDYTIMGNSVNLASRLESVNKQYGTGGILISEYTRARIDDGFLCRRLDRVRVVGISEPLRLYELTGLTDEADEAELQFSASWEEAIAMLEAGNFSQAVCLFNALLDKKPQDKAAALYAKRCAEYLIMPPDPEWDGIINLHEK